MAKRSAVMYSLLMYGDEFMEDPNHYCIMLPNDIPLQRHLLRVRHDLPVGMRRGHEATYGSLSYGMSDNCLLPQLVTNGF